MRELIKDVMSHLQIGQSGKFSLINCNELVKEIKVNLEPLINSERAIIKTTNLPVIFGNKAEILQLFQNLISNAIKYKKPKTLPIITISVNILSKEHVFEFSDNGIGFEENYNNIIFSPFKKLHSNSEYEGTGIGLANAKKIVELHGGKIWAKSNPNVGTTFYFTIKKYGKNKLYIDDDEATNFIHQMVIEDADICSHLVVKDNAYEALKYLEQKDSIKPNLIFLDINMPKMNGWQFLERYINLKGNPPHKITTIMLSSSLNPNDLKEQWQLRK